MSSPSHLFTALTISQPLLRSQSTPPPSPTGSPKHAREGVTTERSNSTTPFVPLVSKAGHIPPKDAFKRMQKPAIDPEVRDTIKDYLHANYPEQRMQTRAKVMTLLSKLTVEEPGLPPKAVPQLLKVAIENGDEALIQTLGKKAGVINVVVLVDANGKKFRETPVSYAIKQNEPQIVAALINLLNVNQASPFEAEDAQYPLQVAVREADEKAASHPTLIAVLEASPNLQTLTTEQIKKLQTIVKNDPMVKECLIKAWRPNSPQGQWLETHFPEVAGRAENALKKKRQEEDESLIFKMDDLDEEPPKKQPQASVISKMKEDPNLEWLATLFESSERAKNALPDVPIKRFASPGILKATGESRADSPLPFPPSQKSVTWLPGTKTNNSAFRVNTAPVKFAPPKSESTAKKADA